MAINVDMTKAISPIVSQMLIIRSDLEVLLGEIAEMKAERKGQNKEDVLDEFEEKSNKLFERNKKLMIDLIDDTNKDQ